LEIWNFIVIEINSLIYTMMLDDVDTMKDTAVGAHVDIDIHIDIFVNCSWVGTRWQYTFTHKQYIEHHN
jgi:hypothetical protein